MSKFCIFLFLVCEINIFFMLFVSYPVTFYNVGVWNTGKANKIISWNDVENMRRKLRICQGKSLNQKLLFGVLSHGHWSLHLTCVGHHSLNSNLNLSKKHFQLLMMASTVLWRQKFLYKHTCVKLHALYMHMSYLCVCVCVCVQIYVY